MKELFQSQWHLLQCQATDGPKKVLRSVFPLRWPTNRSRKLPEIPKCKVDKEALLGLCL